MAYSKEQLARRLADQVQRAAGKGLDAARVFLTSRVKETLSVPAPRVRVKTTTGDVYYRATVPATPKAPPRKLSGRLRTSVTSERLSERLAIVGAKARSPAGFNYPRFHELRGAADYSGEHPFLVPTAWRWRKALLEIMGKTLHLILK